MMRFCVSLIGLCFSFSLFSNPVVEDLNRLLNDIRTLKANYQQTTTDPKFRDKQITTGTVMLERPNQFRWAVVKPYQQLLVADGEQLWIYDIDLEQVTVQPLSNDIHDTPALLLAGESTDISEHFEVSRASSSLQEQSFILTPKKEDSLMKSVKLVFQGSAIKQLSMLDNLDQIVEINFSDLVTNSPIPQDMFRFVVPAGVDVIGEPA